MGDPIVTGTVPSLRQSFNRSEFAGAIQSGRLVKEVIVDLSGYFEIRCIDWHDYWRGFYDGLRADMKSDLETLRLARQAYLNSGYDLVKAKAYVCSNKRTLFFDDEVYYPLRTFNLECLRLGNGRSLLQELVKVSRLAIIEDVDLEACHVRDHLSNDRSAFVSVSDTTDKRRMQRSNLFCMTQAKYAELLPGVRIW